MTGELVTTTETFQDIPVRIVQTDKERLMPLKDVAEATGLNRETLRQLLKRNHEILGQYTCSVITLDQGQGRETTCLTSLGYQVRAGKEWKLTVSGLMYGKMMPYTVKVGLTSHSGYRPLWDPEIISKIQNYRPGLLEGQKGLLAGYL